MAVPKKKTSKTRKGKRRRQIKLTLPNLSRCRKCGGAKKPHVVCPECGLEH